MYERVSNAFDALADVNVERPRLVGTPFRKRYRMILKLDAEYAPIFDNDAEALDDVSIMVGKNEKFWPRTCNNA